MSISINKQQSSSSSVSDNCGATPQQVQPVAAPQVSAAGSSAEAAGRCAHVAQSPPASRAIYGTDCCGDQAVATPSPLNVAMMNNLSSFISSCCSYCSSSTFMALKPSKFLLFALLLLHCSVSMGSGRVMDVQQHHHHHHHHSHQHQQLLDTVAGADDAVLPSSEMISMINGELLFVSSSSRKMVSDDAEDVCGKSSDREATIIQSLSKTTGEPVLLVPQQRFKVAFCEQSITTGSASAETEQCAVGSNCATVYRWAKALVQPPPKSVVEQQQLQLNIGTPAELEFADDVLVPMDCLCVLNWAKLFRGKGPIIFG